MAKRAQLACPVVGRRTRFQPDQTAWNAAEERKQANPTWLSNSIGLRYPIVECPRFGL
jgi:hypothetical protein